MMKKFFIFLSFVFFFQFTKAQEAFTIKHYSVDVKVNKDASLDFTEKLDIHFTEPRHGIIRKIQYQYPMEKLPAGIEKAERQMSAKGFTKIFIEKIKVPGHEVTVSKSGDYKSIKIGSADKLVNGDQQYVIKYQVLNAINFFKNHSELYYDIIGHEWATTITSVDFKIELPEALPDSPYFFVATGEYGSKENKTITQWEANKIFSGYTTGSLMSNEGLTIGISFPEGFLTKPNYTFLHIWWLVLPAFVFFIMYKIWKRWGKDEDVTVQTEYYPPENISPSVSGYIIDNKLDRRDLTALIPYWGAGSFMHVNEIEKSSLLGLIKNKEADEREI